MALSKEVIRSLYRQFEAHPAVSTDSRRVVPGSIFFALRGEIFDGNRFAAEALEKGAAWAVVDDPAAIPAKSAQAARFVPVENALEALQHLAAFHRRTLVFPILAVTGSNGKTTTKELLRVVLSRKFRVSVTEGNLNNHIGVPLTLLKMHAQQEFGIVEMGANAPGEIAALCEIAQPDYGLITNVGRAHLEGFGGIEGVERAKGELYDWLGAHGGLAFLHEEDPVLTRMAAARPELRISGYRAKQGEMENHLEGGYNRNNMAAAAAVGSWFGVAEAEIAAAVAGYRPGNNRSQRLDTGRNTLILDCYNANPSSMAAALDHFAALPAPAGILKTVMLGDMLELGEWAAHEHKEILRKVTAMKPDEIFLVGSHFSAAVAACSFEKSMVRTFPDQEALTACLSNNPLSGRLLLLKGSRGIGLEKIIPLL